MAHNWHWGLSIDTNIKINIFGTLPVKSANFIRNNYSHNFFKHDGISTNFYFFLKSKLLSRSFILNKSPYHFHNNSQFCIFVNIPNSSFCHVFITNTALVTFQSLGIIKNSRQSTCSLLSKYHNFFENDQISFLECL